MNEEPLLEYVARASGSVGCEIIDPNGEIVAWTVDGWWAAVIVGLLNRVDADGLSRHKNSTLAVRPTGI
jgi:hypothetical protein